MSAFMVSDRHIDAIVAGYLRFVSMCSPAGATKIGRGLLIQNARSVCHRYGEDIEEYMPQIEAYTYTQFQNDMCRKPVGVLKLLACYDYQACETPEYEKSDAADCIESIRGGIISELPGYEEAEWCLR